MSFVEERKWLASTEGTFLDQSRVRSGAGYSAQAVGDGLVVKSYKETLKDLILAMEIDEIFGYITLGIFFIVIFFVIGIFAFLSVYARIRQIGVLRDHGSPFGDSL